MSLYPVRIRLLARNLLTNAIRHTPKGRRQPKLSSHVDDECWMLAVSDSGPGITRDQLRRMATPFYSADPSRKRESGGTGLGLYLSSAIAEAHGGTSEIDSAVGKGTRVLVRMPVPSPDLSTAR